MEEAPSPTGSSFKRTKESLKIPLVMPETANLSVIQNSRTGERRSWHDSLSKLSQDLQLICGSPSKSPNSPSGPRRRPESTTTSRSNAISNSVSLTRVDLCYDDRKSSSSGGSGGGGGGGGARKSSLRRSETLREESSARKRILVRHYESQDRLRERLSAICGVTVPSQCAPPRISLTALFNDSGFWMPGNVSDGASLNDRRVSPNGRIQFNDSVFDSNFISDEHRHVDVETRTRIRKIAARPKASNVELYSTDDNSLVTKICLPGVFRIAVLSLALDRSRTKLKVFVRGDIVAEKNVDANAVPITQLCGYLVDGDVIAVRHNRDQFAQLVDCRGLFYLPLIHVDQIERDFVVAYRIDDGTRENECHVTTRDNFLLVETRSRKSIFMSDDYDSPSEESGSGGETAPYFKLRVELPESILPRTTRACLLQPNQLIIKAKFIN